MIMKTIKKADLNNLLKELGSENIRYSGSMYERGRTIRRDGKMIKGIFASSHSPMDVTSVKRDRANENFNTVVNAILAKFGGEITLDHHNLKIITIGKKTVNVSMNSYPLYAPEERMDHGYTQSIVTAYIS